MTVQRSNLSERFLVRTKDGINDTAKRSAFDAGIALSRLSALAYSILVSRSLSGRIITVYLGVLAVLSDNEPNSSYVQEIQRKNFVVGRESHPGESTDHFQRPSGGLGLFFALTVCTQLTRLLGHAPSTLKYESIRFSIPSFGESTVIYKHERASLLPQHHMNETVRSDWFHPADKSRANLHQPPPGSMEGRGTAVCSSVSLYPAALRVTAWVTVI